MKVAFRVDGNNEIGLGHIMRCTALAIKLRQHGALCQFFISKDTKINETIKGYGFDYVKVNSEYNQFDESVNELNFYIENQGYELVVIDSYFVTNSFFKKLNPKAKTVFITEDYPEQTDITCNYFLNYNLYLNNYEPPVSNQTQYLLGTKYCLIRDEFSNCKFKSKTNDILILAGGTDPLNCIEKITKYLLPKNEIKKHTFLLVVSKNKNSIHKLKETFRDNKRVRIITDPQDMSDVMSSCHLAITAAGSTLYEVFACGTPAISYSFVDNQEKIAEAFSKNQIIEYAGKINVNPTETLHNIFNYILLNSKRKNIKKFSKEVINVNGAELLASVLIDGLNYLN